MNVIEGSAWYTHTCHHIHACGLRMRLCTLIMHESDPHAQICPTPRS